jgi:DNA-binding helix-hairpin-helix protein with protein kinase domain
MSPTNIQKSALGNLTKLGRGGQGTVFRAPRAQLTLQGKAFGETVYKEYHSDKLNDIEVSVLRKMVAFLSSLPFAEGTNLVARAAWPVCLVEEGSKTVGFLMPCFLPRFIIDNYPVPSGRSRRVKAEFQHLLNDDKFLSVHGITLTDRDRYELLYELAASLELFHGYKIAVGDLSPKNVLFSFSSPKPSVYFIDCDSMKFRGEGVLPQGETASWDIRPISPSEDLATPQTDRYKFGLFVLRLFAGDQTTRDHNRLPSGVPNDVRSMVKQSLSPKAQYRPEMRKWFKPLEEAARSAAKVAWPLQSLTSSASPASAKKSKGIVKKALQDLFDPFRLFTSGD